MRLLSAPSGSHASPASQTTKNLIGNLALNAFANKAQVIDELRKDISKTIDTIYMYMQGLHGTTGDNNNNITPENKTQSAKTHFTL